MTTQARQVWLAVTALSAASLFATACEKSIERTKAQRV